MVGNFYVIFCWKTDLPTVFVVNNVVGKFSNYCIISNCVGKLHAFVAILSVICR